MNLPASKIFLFDIDGVLVEPRGYRAAIRETLRYYTLPMGLPDLLLPVEDDIAHYEAHRITSEWDMVPLSLAALLESLLTLNPDLPLPEQAADLRHLRPQRLPLQVDYRTPLQQLGPLVKPGRYPAEIALELAGTLYPHLAGQPLLKQLLLDTRSAARNPTTRIFQHFSIGSQEFERAFRSAPDFETPSLLETLDRPLLPPEQRQAVLEGWQTGRLSVSAYTLRPSLPPRSADPLGYSPEAEIALRQVGFESLPRIGYGHIQYLAHQTGSDLELLTKPSPGQALAAIFCALTRQEEAGLELAYAFYQRSLLGIEAPRPNLNGFRLEQLAPLDVHIFEDSAGGIEAVQKAGKILTQNGLNSRVTAWGISQHPDKVQALHKVEAQVRANVGQALQEALSL